MALPRPFAPSVSHRRVAVDGLTAGVRQVGHGQLVAGSDQGE